MRVVRSIQGNTVSGMKPFLDHCKLDETDYVVYTRSVVLRACLQDKLQKLFTVRNLLLNPPTHKQ